jgi:hypothetical protein
MQRTIATVRLLLTDGSSVDLLELADIVKKCDERLPPTIS